MREDEPMADPKRSDRGTVGNRLNDDERYVLSKSAMWGSAMYPVMRVSGGWVLDSIRSVTVPGVFDTKAEAVAAFERFIDVLVAASGQEAYERVAGLS